MISQENFFGRGGTGGFVLLPGPIGQEAARLALRIFDGENASNIPITQGNFSKPVFDWRELQRWQIDTARLPPGSEVRFRPASLWKNTVGRSLPLVLFSSRKRHLSPDYCSSGGLAGVRNMRLSTPLPSNGCLRKFPHPPSVRCIAMPMVQSRRGCKKLLNFSEQIELRCGWLPVESH